MNRVLVAAILAVGLMGCEKEKPSTGMQTYTALADIVCACKAAQCVDDAVTKWTSKLTPEQLTTRSDEAQALTALQNRINGCLEATSRASGSRPHSSMQLVLPSPK